MYVAHAFQEGYDEVKYDVLTLFQSLHQKFVVNEVHRTHHPTRYPHRRSFIREAGGAAYRAGPSPRAAS